MGYSTVTYLESKIDTIEYDINFVDGKMFTYGGVQYSSFNISSNGYIFF